MSIKENRRLARHSPRAEVNNAIACNTVQWNWIPYGTMHAIQYNTTQYHKGTKYAIQYDTNEKQFNTIQSFKIAYNAFQTKTEHYWPQKGHFEQLVPENGPPSSQLGTYQKTEDIESYLRICGSYDRVRQLEPVTTRIMEKQSFFILILLLFAMMDHLVLSLVSFKSPWNALEHCTDSFGRTDDYVRLLVC